MVPFETVTVTAWEGSTFEAPFAGTVVVETGGNVGDGDAVAAAPPLAAALAAPSAVGSCLEPEPPEPVTAAAMPPTAPTVTSPPAMIRARRGNLARGSGDPSKAAAPSKATPPGTALFGGAPFGGALFGGALFEAVLFGAALFEAVLFEAALFEKPGFENAVFGNALSGSTGGGPNGAGAVVSGAAKIGAVGEGSGTRRLGCAVGFRAGMNVVSAFASAPALALVLAPVSGLATPAPGRSAEASTPLSSPAPGSVPDMDSGTAAAPSPSPGIAELTPSDMAPLLPCPGRDRTLLIPLSHRGYPPAVSIVSKGRCG
jgi:hypothetical protein